MTNTKATNPVAKPKAAKPKAHQPGEPVAYSAPHPVYVGGVYYEAGKPFVTDEPKGEHWEYMDPAAKAAAEAADPQNRQDPNIDGMDDSALDAYAASINVQLPEGLSRDEKIAVIKAANDPTR